MNRFRYLLQIVVSCSLFTTLVANTQSYVPEWNNKKVKVKEKVNINAYAFNPKDVKLLESPFKQAMQADV
ncbi:MAG: hypothetical protein ICV65_13945, partial [Flavisolibacter sp.]|nr:hypothetical protein [Flavisolibacter sp.]